MHRARTGKVPSHGGRLIRLPPGLNLQSPAFKRGGRVWGRQVAPAVDLAYQTSGLVVFTAT
jgi:hypothetical protein